MFDLKINVVKRNSLFMFTLTFRCYLIRNTRRMKRQTSLIFPEVDFYVKGEKYSLLVSKDIIKEIFVKYELPFNCNEEKKEEH